MMISYGEPTLVNPCRIFKRITSFARLSALPGLVRHCMNAQVCKNFLLNLSCKSSLESGPFPPPLYMMSEGLLIK